jgi:hypothetical protein
MKYYNKLLFTIYKLHCSSNIVAVEPSIFNQTVERGERQRYCSPLPDLKDRGYAPESNGIAG